MIVPRFTVDQNDEFVFVRISLPYVKVSASEVVVEDCDFTFYCRPFLLKLRFPHPFVDDDRCKAVFDPMSPEGGSVLVSLPKAQLGLHFPDLDIISRLLSDRRGNDLREMALERAEGGGAAAHVPPAGGGVPKIEVLASEDAGGPGDGDSADAGRDELDGDAILIPDRISAAAFDQEGEDLLVSLTAPKYGFENRYSRVFSSTGDTFAEAVEVQEPDSLSRAARRAHRTDREENGLFDGPRYLGDTIGAADDEIAVEALRFEPFWCKQWEAWRRVAAGAGLTDEERAAGVAPPASADDCFPWAGGGFHAEAIEEMTSEVLTKPFLPPIISESDQGRKTCKMLLCSLSDILFGFCYEWRLTCGEPGVESAANAARLSATLSWLEDYGIDGNDATTVVHNSMRRCLSCAYMRTWSFGRKVLADVAKVLLCGKRCVLNCLLLFHRMLRKTATHYILARIYLTDYCLWVQSLDDAVLTDFGLRYNDALRVLSKGSVGLGLLEWEEQLPDSSSEEDSSSNDDDDESSDSECSSSEGERDMNPAVGISQEAAVSARGGVVAVASLPSERLFLSGRKESDVAGLSDLLAARLTVGAAPKRPLIEEIPGPALKEETSLTEADTNNPCT